MEARQKVYDYLNDNGLNYTVNEHPAVYTVEAMAELGLDKLGGVIKNLFLRDAKGKRHFLLLIAPDKKADLKKLQSKIGSTSLQFASEDRLKKYLGLSKGSVGPFGLLNEGAETVEIIWDSDLEKYDQVGVHPNDNTATVWLKGRDLKDVIIKQGNSLKIMPL